jgi:tetratricopeptide (TPR) repeat protein
MTKENSIQNSKAKPVKTAQPNEDKWKAFYEKHKDMFGYISVGILIILALGTLMRFNTQNKEKQASILFQKAVSEYQKATSPQEIPQNQQSEEASAPVQANPVGAFQEIIDNYPTTHTGKNAELMLAASYLNSGDYEKAISTYDQFLKNNTGSLLEPYAYLGISTADFNAGKLEESQQYLQKIIDKYPNFELSDIVKFEMAKRFEAQQNWDKAREYYQQVIDLYPKSSWKYQADTKKKDLDQKHPAQTNAESQKGDPPA